MSRPVIFAVDENETSLLAIESELLDRYGRGYRVVCVETGREAEEELARLAEAGEDVALVLAGEVLEGVPGSELLGAVRRQYPQVQRALLIDYGSWGKGETGRTIFAAMALRRIDYYVIRPTREQDELFHQAISTFLLEWQHARRLSPHTAYIVGESWSGRAHELREVLGRCALPHKFCLADSAEGREVVEEVGAAAKLPLVMFPNGEYLVDPSNVELTEAAGGPVDPGGREFDLVIVGAGPAGLSAAVYGASEGLRTLVIGSGGIGGQATLSSLIRNYLGFPRGVSGRQLAERAYEQAWVFGTQFAFMQTATGLRREGERIFVGLSDFPEVEARAVVLAAGATYRRLEVEELEALALDGAGVFYGSTATEAPALEGREVFVVGGANSAGQAALHLADYASRVTLVVRADSLAAGMSHYLIQQIAAAPNIDVRTGTEVVGGGGDGHLEWLELRERGAGGDDTATATDGSNTSDGSATTGGSTTTEGSTTDGAATETVPADALFLMIGARPNTDWLPDEILRDAGGFIRTGPALAGEPGWSLARAPFSHETSMPGVFAVGDVRNGSMSRVAAAVGEGSIAVRLVHELFATERLGAPAA